MYETSSNFNFFVKYQKNKIYGGKDQAGNQSADNINFEKQRKVIKKELKIVKV